MAVPLAHPAAVLPLMRWCPRYLDALALVVGSIVPDVAYALADADDFHATLERVLGSSIGQLTWIREQWSWDELSHSLAGTVVFCVPIGIVAVAGVLWLRRPLVRLFPEPFRDALLPLCVARPWSVTRVSLSLLVASWTHLAWDLFTNGGRWLGRHWDGLLVELLHVGAASLRLYRLLWFLTTAIGLLVLFRVLSRQMKERLGGAPLFVAHEWRCYMGWVAGLTVCVAFAAGLAWQWADPFGSVAERWQFAHRTIGYGIAAATLAVAMAAVTSLALHGQTLPPGD